VSLKTLTLAGLVICSILITLENSNAAKPNDIDDGRSRAGTGNANLFKINVSQARESAFARDVHSYAGVGKPRSSSGSDSDNLQGNFKSPHLDRHSWIAAQRYSAIAT
jgi:hypothetical protein